MSDKELEIFNLCERLAELLGDKEAIADLKRLYDKHPEMFNNMQEVSSTIKEVVEEPEIIVDANKDNRDYKVIKAAKALNNERMADVVIKNESGTNEIFHTNKKRVKEFDRLKNRENLLQVETPTPSTRQLNGLELMDENPSGANALSATTNNIIPQSQDKAEQNQHKIRLILMQIHLAISLQQKESHNSKEIKKLFPKCQRQVRF